MSPDRFYVDASDLIVPPVERGAVFITSRFSVTRRQHQGWCPLPSSSSPSSDSSSSSSSFCRKDSDCQLSDSPLDITASRCNINNHICEYYQWCPPENEDDFNTTQSYRIKGLENVTLWMKGSITFPGIDKNRLFSTIKSQNPVPYDPNHPQSRSANLYSLKQIINVTKNIDDDISFETILANGILMKVKLHWKCNLFYSNDTKACVNELQSEARNIPKETSGINIRRPEYYMEDGTQYRDLWKLYGFRFILYSSGKGYRFSFIAIGVQLGSALALLSLANLSADYIMIYLLPGRKVYRTYKFRNARLEPLVHHDKNTDENADEKTPLNDGVDFDDYNPNYPYQRYHDLSSDVRYHSDRDYVPSDGSGYRTHGEASIGDYTHSSSSNNSINM